MRQQGTKLFVVVLAGCLAGAVAPTRVARAEPAGTEYEPPVPATAPGDPDRPTTAAVADAATPAPPITGEAGTGGSAPTLDELLARLSSADEETRLAAVRALSELGDAAAVPRLAEILAGDSSEQVRRYAVVALANLGGDEAQTAIVAAARSDSSEEVRRWAEEALRRLDAPTAATPPEPPPPEPAPREPGIEAPVEGDPGAFWSFEEALQALASSRAELRTAAVRRLAELDNPNVVPMLVSRMRIEENVEVRRLMVVALAMLGGDMALEAVLDAALDDPSLVVQATAREALERLGLPVERGVVRHPGSAWGETPAGTEPGAAADGATNLLGEGDVRLGGQIELGMLWRSWSVDVAGIDLVEDDWTLSFSLAPTFGYFVVSWLELGLELDIGYGAGEYTTTMGSGSPTTMESDVVSVALLPQIRAHVGVTDEVFFTVAALLGYGYESSESGEKGAPASERTTVTADGFVIGPELGLEIAADHVLIPIWFRLFYRPWALETSDAPNRELDVEDIVLAFGTGLHAYF